MKLRLRVRALVRAGGRRRERGVKARANTRASWVRECGGVGLGLWVVFALTLL